MRDHLMEKEIKQLKKAEDIVRKDLQKLFEEEEKQLLEPPIIIEKSPDIKV